MWRVKFRAVPSQSRHSAVFCVSSFLKLNLKSRPEVFKGPETDSTWIKQGFTKWLQNSEIMMKYIAQKALVCYENNTYDV